MLVRLFQRKGTADEAHLAVIGKITRRIGAGVAQRDLRIPAQIDSAQDGVPPLGIDEAGPVNVEHQLLHSPIDLTKNSLYSWTIRNALDASPA
ncbi:hypothetical protein D3C87_1348680 [compost metagenome]